MLIETPIKLQETGNAQEPRTALLVFQQTPLFQVIPQLISIYNPRAGIL